jgi:alkanesulfonate monooxygenase SsuD/methylene tetrahydromethanopterin reductase-like flavin-dependent oxidoreductase (luciferase family)
VGVNLVLPDLSPTPLEVPANAITGTPEQLAGELRAYEQAGAAHVILALEPAVPATVEVVGAAIGTYRGNA